MKDEENTAAKPEEKSCNNPLAGLANTINSITNGVSSEEPTTIPITVPLTANSRHVPPKAMVKPQVLTHVIEGFVIQEGNYKRSIESLCLLSLRIIIFTLTNTFITASEPFAVNRTSLNNAVNQDSSNILNRNNASEKDNHDEPPSKIAEDRPRLVIR